MEAIKDRMTSDQLIDDFKTVMADTDALLKATANEGDGMIASARARTEASMKAVNAKILAAQDALMMRTRAAAKAADVYVHQSPWQAVGIAAATGIVLGWLISRR